MNDSYLLAVQSESSLGGGATINIAGGVSLYLTRREDGKVAYLNTHNAHRKNQSARKHMEDLGTH